MNTSTAELELMAEEIGDGQTEAIKPPLTDEEVLALVKEDHEIAKKSKHDLEAKIRKWKELYEGKPLGNETEGRSQYVSKDAQKAVNWWIPNAMKPFMSSNDIADFIPRTYDDIKKAKSQNTLINYQFNNDFPKYQFLYTSLQLYSSEGTVVARTGWIHDEESEVIPFEGFTQEQISELEAQGAEIEIEDEAEVVPDAMEDPERQIGTVMIYKGTATITKTTVSRPDADPIKNEDFWIIGETIEDADACIQRIDTNISDLREQDKKYSDRGIYTNVDEIKVKSVDTRDDTLGQQRNENLEEYGKPDDGHKRSNGRDDVTIYEYYGKIDINQDGIAEDIVCVWSGNTILRIAENPFPDKEPPYIGVAFMPIAFSFWGNALAHFLEDTSRVKTAMVRTAIDLMANSTNGMKHIQKSSLDALNLRRLKEAKIGTVVEWNDMHGYNPQNTPEIPSTMLPMIEYFTAEGENESGITRYNQGLDAKSLNKTATGITAIMGQAQMRTWETVTRFAEQYMKPLFRKWIAYNQAFLDTSIAIRVVGDQYEEISRDDIGGEFDLTVNVAVAGSEEVKSQKIIGMLNMITPLVQQGVVPPNHLTKLIAELEELSGFKDLAQELIQIADAKAQAKSEAVQGFLSMPEDMQVQIMQQVAAMQQNNGNPQAGGAAQ